jgi:hypothetical protein
MKMIYEESPKRFQELLAALIQGDVDLQVGPVFTQQTKEKESIPDLSISQQSFSIFFETKLSNWFYSDQIQRHLEGFHQQNEVKILFLLSNFDTDEPEQQFEKSIEKAKANGVILQPLSFESFVDALESVANTDYLSNVLDDFRLYLDRSNLLPKWKYLLDVVSCGGTMHEVNAGAYMCPDTGGAYRHQRAKFLGPYAHKKVETIFEIKAIVTVEKNLAGAEVKWNNTHEPEDSLKQEAMDQLKLWESRVNENKSVALQVFLLANPAKTLFRKQSRGGMMQSKKYFWDIALDCDTSAKHAHLAWRLTLLRCRSRGQCPRNIFWIASCHL